MKDSFFAGLLLLLYWLPVTCQAQSLTRSFVVELQRDERSPNGSVSVKLDHNTWPGNFTSGADVNGSVLPPDSKHRPGGYGVKAYFESISWQLIYASHLLVAYKLVMTTRDASGPKPYSWIPVETFVAVGWLLKSYWNSGSPLFNPMGQLEANEDDPFAITTMIRLGRGKQPNQHPNQHPSQQRNQPTASSDQLPEETTAQPTGSLVSHLHHGAGGSNGPPDQHQHTLGLDCFVHPCNGVCRFRQLSNRAESAEWSLDSIMADLDTLIVPVIDIEDVTDFGSVDRSVYLPDGLNDPSDDTDLLIYLPADPPADTVTQGIDSNPANSHSPGQSTMTGTVYTTGVGEENCDR